MAAGRAHREPERIDDPTRPIFVLSLAAVLGGLLLGMSLPAAADPTQFPLTIHNCGSDLTFTKPPNRVVTLGQANTEVLLSLGLAGKIVGTAVWFGPVLPEYAAADAKIKRLADNDPSFEAVVGQNPDLVSAQYEWHIPHGSVGKPDQFAALGIPAYIAPADCAAKDNSGGGDGVRLQQLTMEPVFQEIRDVADRGEALVAKLKQREAQAIV
jgi:iron complex transport system substrate-binding protein